MSEPLPDRVYTVIQVATFLDTSVPTVYRLVRNKRLRASKVGGEWRITGQALRDLLEDNINF